MVGERAGRKGLKGRIGYGRWRMGQETLLRRLPGDARRLRCRLETFGGEERVGTGARGRKGCLEVETLEEIEGDNGVETRPNVPDDGDFVAMLVLGKLYRSHRHVA